MNDSLVVDGFVVYGFMDNSLMMIWLMDIGLVGNDGFMVVRCSFMLLCCSPGGNPQTDTNRAQLGLGCSDNGAS